MEESAITEKVYNSDITMGREKVCIIAPSQSPAAIKYMADRHEGQLRYCNKHDSTYILMERKYNYRESV